MEEQGKKKKSVKAIAAALIVILFLVIAVAVMVPAFLGQREKGRSRSIESGVKSAVGKAEEYYQSFKSGIDASRNPQQLKEDQGIINQEERLRQYSNEQKSNINQIQESASSASKQKTLKPSAPNVIAREAGVNAVAEPYNLPKKEERLRLEDNPTEKSAVLTDKVDAKSEPALEEDAAKTPAATAPIASAGSSDDADGASISGKVDDKNLRRDENVKDMQFQKAEGYWQNTYVPGDPYFHYLHAAVEQEKINDKSLQRQEVSFDDLSKQYWQPFDPPQNYTALALYLSADNTSIDGPTRMLVQVGIKGTSKKSGRRPAMNIGIVLDLRKNSLSEDLKEDIDALLKSFVKAKRIDDRFSLTVVGSNGGCLIKPEDFKHGSVVVTLGELFNSQQNDSSIILPRPMTLPEAFSEAVNVVKQSSSPNEPLGASSIIIISADLNNDDTIELEAPIHKNALDGITVSAIGIGSTLNLEALNQIVLIGQGSRRILEAPEQAEALVNRELFAVGSVVARAIRLQIRLLEGVKLIEVLGSKRLDDSEAHREKETETALDNRLARNLGIERDRGFDTDGIQIIIPSFYADDTHVVMLDVLVEKTGPIADVALRYKDLIYLRNSTIQANLTLDNAPKKPLGPIEYNVIKNFLAYKQSEAMIKAGEFALNNNYDSSITELTQFRALLQQHKAQIKQWQTDAEISQDLNMLNQYIGLLQNKSDASKYNRFIGQSLQYAGLLKVLPKPQEN
ncbi:hypothetical protein MCHI_001018 [Candidatus Magnetoovum chiemensis]|nr:hypothetical protein MCHI_001018 [Candidatus Magnetoovum chiemensis]